MADTAEPWHQDRKVMVALITTIILQTGMAIWWASDLTSKVNQINNSNVEQDVRIRSVEQVVQAQQVAAATISAQIVAMRETLEMVRQDQRETNGLLRQYLESRQGSGR